MASTLAPYIGRSDLRGALALLRDWGGIAGLMALQVWVLPWWTLPLTGWAIAHLQFAIGEALVHEASHGQLFATRGLNRWLAPVLAWPFGFTLTGYRTEHLDHHRHFGSARDHIHVAYARYGLRQPDDALPDPPVGPSRAAWIWVGRPLCGLVALDVLRDIADLARHPDRETPGLVLSWAAVVAITLATGTFSWFVALWLLPLVFGFTALLYWSEVGDHFVIPQGDTRTIRSPLTNWLHHHNGLHALHHKYPAIPFFRLPAAYAAMQGDFPETVSHGWWDTWRQLAGGPTGR